jgi:beta-aspartyl-peptidase (threonine type)
MLLVVHGGAGSKKPAGKALRKLSGALSDGYEVLKSGGTALDAVEAAIVVMEDSGLFNAGLGGNLQFDGIKRLDASLMEGGHLRAGSVIGLEGRRNPVRAARLVMDTPHVMFTDRGARMIASGLEPLPEISRKELEKLSRIKKRHARLVKLYEEHFSTVGAVALDRYGSLASGSSTGGVAAMLPGRVGDTPVIGAGVYADDSSGAVSCTGNGEAILRLSLAKEICMDLKTRSPLSASRHCLKRLLRAGGKAGVIVINRQGRFSMVHSTKYMASGYINDKMSDVREASR